MSQQQATLTFQPIDDQSFDQFIGNDAVVKVLQEPENLPQFCYLYGPKFSGKTHLLAALTGVLQQANIAHFSLAASQLQQHDMTAVLPQNLQFLLVDDVDVLVASEQGELALFNLFNYCKSQSIKLLVSASLHTRDDRWQLPDLVSRLSSGLTLNLEPLKGEQALACLQQQFELNGIPVDAAVLQYLQAHHSSRFTELFKLFVEVAAESLKYKRKVTVPLIKQVLKNLDDKYSLA